jgi:hypothetical protein
MHNLLIERSVMLMYSSMSDLVNIFFFFLVILLSYQYLDSIA